jgi:streptogramin lyase
MAIDENGLPWVGTYNDNMLRRLDPGTGAVLEEHDVGMPVYGIAIDAEGIIWFASLRIPEFTGGRIGAFSIEDQEVIGTWAIPGCSNPYSLAIDADGDVWLGNFTCDNLVHLDRETRAITTHTLPTLDRTRGVAVDGEDKIWVVSYGTNRVARFDPETGSFIGSYPVCQGPTGVAVAEDDHIWVSCWGSDNAYQLTYDGTHTDTVSLGRDPYGYSDMTGFQLRNFTGRRGTWTVQWDCGHDVCIFNEARWQATLPPEGEIVLRARVSQDGESWTSWAGPYITQPANLSVLPPGRYIELEVQLRTSNRDISPLLDQVELYWSRP